jgi:hypothetical protein
MKKSPRKKEIAGSLWCIKRARIKAPITTPGT